MKKLIAVLCVMALMVTAILPAVAEQNMNGGMQGQPPQMSQNQGGKNVRGGQGGNNDQTPPEKPEGDPSSRSDSQTPPEMPADGTSGSTQNPPEMPGDQNGTQPAGRPDGQNGAQPDSQTGSTPQEKKDPLQKLVDDGKLSQTTYDAIQDYMKQNGASAGADQQTPPEKPEDSASADQQTPPEKPEGSEPATAPQGQPGNGGMLSAETLQSMLNDGVITEAEYNVILEAVSQSAETGSTPEAADSEISLEEING